MKVLQRGQTLIELLVALGIVSVIITSITVATITSLHNANFVNNQSQATKYAQEGIEIVRNIRDTNYVSFKNYVGTYCLNKGQQTLSSPVSSCSTKNIDQTYVRSVKIEQSPGCVATAPGTVAKVTVSVAWNDSKCQDANTYCNVVPAVSCLSTQNPISAP